MVQLIVFLPLIAAIVAGLGGRWIGNSAAKFITTAALFVGAAREFDQTGAVAGAGLLLLLVPGVDELLADAVLAGAGTST